MLFCIAYFIIIYIIDWRIKFKIEHELDPLTKNEVSYEDAK